MISATRCIAGAAASQSGNPGSNYVLSCRTLGKFVHSTLLQLTLLYESVLVYRQLWICVCEYIELRINVNVAECFPEKSRSCLHELVCHGVECNALKRLNNLFPNITTFRHITLVLHLVLVKPNTPNDFVYCASELECSRISRCHRSVTITYLLTFGLSYMYPRHSSANSEWRKHPQNKFKAKKKITKMLRRARLI